MQAPDFSLRRELQKVCQSATPFFGQICLMATEQDTKLEQCSVSFVLRRLWRRMSQDRCAGAFGMPFVGPNCRKRRETARFDKGHQTDGVGTRSRWAGSHRHYLPMQNWLKIASSKSSVAVFPTISPTALTAMRKSKATSSSVKSPFNASRVRTAPSRARRKAS